MFRYGGKNYKAINKRLSGHAVLQKAGRLTNHTGAELGAGNQTEVTMAQHTWPLPCSVATRQFMELLRGAGVSSGWDTGASRAFRRSCLKGIWRGSFLHSLLQIRNDKLFAFGRDRA